MFSNWSAHSVEIYDKVFLTADHAYHYKKYIEDNPAAAKEILKARRPHQAKLVARKYKEKCRKDWDKIKWNVFYEILKAKTEQHEDVLEKLISTGKATIIEDSPYDNYWGTGPEGKGENQLGKIWMKIRGEVSLS